MKKKLLLIATGLLFAASLVGAYSLGNARGQPEIIIRNDDEPQVIEVIEGSDQIAVVNLDVGVELASGEHVFHSDHAINFPTEAFRFASLNEARIGIEANHFGAYIIIPANFSQNVESLNDIPTRILLEYEVSQLLSGEEQRDILYQVLHFGDSLNSDLSYVYLSNILAEFHQAQDDSLLVLENDQRTAEAIHSIQPRDLVEMIQLPELVREEEWIEGLDLSSYMSLSEQLVQGLGSDYEEKIQLNNNQLTLLTEQGDDIIREIGEVAGRITDVNLLYDVNENRIYEGGIQALNNHFNDFNSEVLSTNREEMIGIMNQMSSRIQYIEERLVQSIEQHYLHLENMQLILNDRPTLSLLEIDTNSYAIESSLENHRVDINLVSVPSPTGEANLQALEGIIGVLLADTDQTVEDALEVANNLLLIPDSSSSEQFLDNIRQRDISLESQTYSIDIQGEVADLADEMFDSFIADLEARLDSENFRFEAFYYDYEDERKTIFMLFSTHEEFLKEVRESLEHIEELDIIPVQDIINTQIINPVVDRSEAVQADIISRQAEGISFMHTHQQQIRDFTPVTDAGFVATSVSELLTIGSEMQGHLFENNQAHIEQNRTLHDTTTKNISNIQSAVMKADEESHLRVEEGLNHAQTLNATLSAQNHNALGDFVQRLPFTRLGTVEFSTAYQFIVRPMLLYHLGNYFISGMNEIITTIVSEPVAIAANMGLSEIWIWLVPIAMGGVLICALTLVVLERRKKKREDF